MSTKISKVSNFFSQKVKRLPEHTILDRCCYGVNQIVLITALFLQASL
jgi:hypothetical protein